MTGPPPLRTPLRASRRRVLGAPAAVVIAGLAGSSTVGCDVSGDVRRSTSAPSPTTATTQADQSAEPVPDPDEALVARTRGDVAEAAALVRAAGQGRPALRRELAPYRRMHAAHLAALPGDDVEVAAIRVRGDAAAARRRVRRGEQALQVRLADASVEADSGQLAALLASMSAAIGQRLAVGEPA